MKLTPAVIMECPKCKILYEFVLDNKPRLWYCETCKVKAIRYIKNSIKKE